LEWTKVTIYTTSEGIEPVTGRLALLGVTGTEIEDGRDLRRFLEENRSRWDYVDESVEKKLAGEPRVNVYLEKNAKGSETLAAIKGSMLALRAADASHAFGRLDTELSGVSEQDWAENWKKYFKPLRVGKKILIRPAWEPVPEGSEGLTVFTVDPGMTFGTGSHETTRLCICELERLVKPGARMLDLGCGSGILSVIALMLGAQSALAVDIDPASRGAAARNAALNGVDPAALSVVTGDVTSDAALRQKLGAGSYDVVAANIVADVIKALAPFVPPLLAPGGRFVCSGIITERAHEVRQTLEENGLAVEKTAEDGGWTAMTLTRRGK
jgi:ribosomal protein L11 methyltransferase